ncbi:hypothetical protein [Streptomyces sp. NPDC006368]|uniref:hypothetical protein n=1 Tax=Streptomyces sp. NPDC006368 TaxID=3156760 RepID=UPI0033A7B350
MERDQETMSELEPGTVQHAQLYNRMADIAWTALCVLLGAWVVWSVIGAVRGTAHGVLYCAVAVVLFTIVLRVRLLAYRRRTE